MGINIRSKRNSTEIGYHGFFLFRSFVAKQINDLFYSHYVSRFESKVMLLRGKEEESYFESYNQKTETFIAQGVLTLDIADFLYQADSDGKIDRKQAKKIHELIKDCEDDLSFGYVGHDDCAKMADLKRIFADGAKITWY